jgi:hypothetical protein
MGAVKSRPMTACGPPDRPSSFDRRIERDARSTRPGPIRHAGCAAHGDPAAGCACASAAREAPSPRSPGRPRRRDGGLRAHAPDQRSMVDPVEPGPARRFRPAQSVGRPPARWPLGRIAHDHQSGSAVLHADLGVLACQCRGYAGRTPHGSAAGRGSHASDATAAASRATALDIPGLRMGGRHGRRDPRRPPAGRDRRRTGRPLADVVRTVSIHAGRAGSGLRTPLTVAMHTARESGRFNRSRGDGMHTGRASGRLAGRQRRLSRLEAPGSSGGARRRS